MRSAAVLVLALIVGSPAIAQEPRAGIVQPNVWPSPRPQAAPAQATPLLTVDQERLFSDSAFGRRAMEDLEESSRALATENRRIESELVVEERGLTDLRNALSAEAFRERARDFDQRVVRIRQEQDGKARELARRSEEERKRLLQAALPILAALVAERGAMAVLDIRAVLIASNQIDITDDAIARLDATLGTGGEPADTAPEAPKSAPPRP